MDHQSLLPAEVVPMSVRDELRNLRMEEQKREAEYLRKREHIESLRQAAYEQAVRTLNSLSELGTVKQENNELFTVTVGLIVYKIRVTVTDYEQWEDRRPVGHKAVAWFDVSQVLPVRKCFPRIEYQHFDRTFARMLYELGCRY